VCAQGSGHSAVLPTWRFNRRHDYYRAQCEDLEVIRGWFALLRDTIAKYGIEESDI
jgi:hypothetical protein